MSHITEGDVLNALRPIEDPDFHRSIVDLGFIKNLSIEGGRVAFGIDWPVGWVSHLRRE